MARARRPRGCRPDTTDLTGRKVGCAGCSDDVRIILEGSFMTASQAVVRIDHAQAELHALGTPAPGAQRLRARSHDTAHHRSDVRDAHEFFAAVSDAIDAHDEALVVGGRHATADFERYLHKHRPATARRVAAFEVADHRTDPELVAFARKFFERRARLGGVFGQTG